MGKVEGDNLWRTLKQNAIYPTDETEGKMNSTERFRPVQRWGYLAVGLAFAISLVGLLTGVNGYLIIAFDVLLMIGWVW